MRLIILQFEVAPFLDDYEQTYGDLPEYSSINEFAIMVILSIIHRHCILALVSDAYVTYEHCDPLYRDRIDEVVENLVIMPDGRTKSYWYEFSRILERSVTVKKVRLRRKRTFEVYCE